MLLTPLLRGARDSMAPPASRVSWNAEACSCRYTQQGDSCALHRLTQ